MGCPEAEAQSGTMLSNNPDEMRLGRGFGKSFRPFAGMTRIRFKGSPLAAVSQRLLGAPLGTLLI
jgi:hypothetical protein